MTNINEPQSSDEMLPSSFPQRTPEEIEAIKRVYDTKIEGITCNHGSLYPNTCALIERIKKAQKNHRPISESGRTYKERPERGQLDQGRM